MLKLIPIWLWTPTLFSLIHIDVHCAAVVDGDDSILQYEDLTDDLPPQPPNNRRSANGAVWRLIVPLKSQSTVTLNLIETDGILANSETPLWSAKGTVEGRVSYRTFTQNLGHKIGEFSLWQDYQNEAAVVYCHRDKVLWGHVQWYAFKLRNVSPPSTRKISFEDKSRGSESEENSGSDGDSDSSEGDSDDDSDDSSDDDSGSRERKSHKKSKEDKSSWDSRLRPNGPSDNAYPQLLILLDWDYVKKSDTEAIQKVLAWWNFADMLYVGVPKPRIRLNIARIVIAENEYTNPWIKEVYQANTNSFNPNCGLAAAGNFYAEQKALFNDKYNFVVSYISTGMSTPTGGFVAGVSHVATSCERRVDRTILISYRTAGYSVAARELGHALGSKYDQQYDECRSDGSIMSTRDRRNYDGLRWSKCSLNAFYEYFSKSTSRCLYNCPPTLGIRCL